MADAFELRGLGRLTHAPDPNVTNHSVDASNEGVAWAFQAPRASAISKLWFRYGSRTGTPPTYRISLQSLGSTGLPDGTVLGGGSPASATFTPPASTAWDTTGQWITLNNTYTPTRGQVLCSVIEYSSGTIDASNFSSFGRSVQSFATINATFPYAITNSVGTWTKTTGNAFPVFAVEDAIGIYGCPVINRHDTTETTSGRRQAAAITLPSTLGSTFVVRGVAFATGRLGSAAGTFKVCVWDASGTELASTGTWDADHQAGVTNTGSGEFLFTSSVTLNYGTKYYFGVESSGSPISVAGANLTNAADRAAHPLGANRAWASWDGSSWTETTTRLPLLDLIFDDITVPSGGGNIIVCGE